MSTTTLLNRDDTSKDHSAQSDRGKQGVNPVEGSDELNSITSTITANEPKTPPHNSGIKDGFQSPDNTYTSLPPATPSVNNSSSSAFKSSNVPETPLAHGKQSPPLKSPSSFYRQSGHDDSSAPAIKQISFTLKSRISNAFVKYQKGWSNKSIDEIERAKDEERELKEQTNFLLSSPISKSTTGRTQTSSKVTKPTIKSPTKPNPSASKSPRPLTRRLSSDSLQEMGDGSANFAFSQAIYKRKSPKKNPTSTVTAKSGSRSLTTAPTLYVSPKSSPTKPHLQTKPAASPSASTLGMTQYTDADAVASLMSLSSPAHPLKVRELPTVNLPRKQLNLSQVQEPTTKKKRTLNTPVESGVEDSGVDTEYEDNDVTDEEMQE
ncbi:hypothetical protein WICPIJ_002791 [Wickerhamomyces pijperi]|uniref:Uncharacterized protein n=1 Tax=Wickerhamomyces pijperi TaxID=599730 RepID=A0A9P8QB62_WICPI|nr:hypothetical protein WICPIJ_002791 [Wickerhamomyces pijperi]